MDWITSDESEPSSDSEFSLNVLSVCAGLCACGAWLRPLRSLFANGTTSWRRRGKIPPRRRGLLSGATAGDASHTQSEHPRVQDAARARGICPGVGTLTAGFSDLCVFGPFLTRVFTREPRPTWAGLRRDAGPVSPSGTNNFVQSSDLFLFFSVAR